MVVVVFVSSVLSFVLFFFVGRLGNEEGTLLRLEGVEFMDGRFWWNTRVYCSLEKCVVAC